MFSDADMKAMKEGSWELPCMEMTLAKNDGKKSYSGAGVIRRNSDGIFNYMLMSPAKEEPESFDALKFAIVEKFSKKPPDNRFLLEDGDYWTLTAIDKDCRKWISDRLVEPGISAGAYPGLFLSGDLGRVEYRKAHSSITKALGLEQKEDVPKKYITYVSFTDYRIPGNTVVNEMRKVGNKEVPGKASASVAKFKALGVDFTMEQLNDYLMLDAKSETEIKLPINILSIRISESLQFCLGRPMEWDMCFLVEGNDEVAILRSFSRRTGNPRVGPPLDYWYPNNIPYVWKLFDKYLSYVAQNGIQEERFQRISSRIWRVLHASTGSWEAEKLTLCVEIEGLLNEYLSSSATPPEKLEKAANGILELIKSEEKTGGRASCLDKDSLGIVKTVVGNLKRGASAINILRQLQEESSVRESDVEAWDSTRNPASHGRSEPEITDEIYGMRGRLVVLLYHIVFHIIGYEGPYSDYGTPRKVVADYKLKKTSC
ncbi:MAG: hypothetical protein WAX69_03390 [Victivallales bacterium]